MECYLSHDDNGNTRIDYQCNNCGKPVRVIAVKDNVVVNDLHYCFDCQKEMNK